MDQILSWTFPTIEMANQFIGFFLPDLLCFVDTTIMSSTNNQMINRSIWSEFNVQMKMTNKKISSSRRKKKKTENFFFVRFVNRTNRFLLFSSLIFKSIWNKNFYRIINLSTIDKTFVQINERLFSFSLQRESHQWRFNVVYRKWRTR